MRTLHTRLLLAALTTAAAMLAQMPEDPGPAKGEPIPAFTALDQHGRTQSFNSLKGPNGLLLLFVRSADW